MKATQVVHELKKLRDSEKAQIFQRFFKTAKGEYGEGDKFWGIKVPLQRKIAKKYKELELDQVKMLIINPVHEARLTGLLILVYKYEKADDLLKKKIYSFYVKNIKAINNWDLVDTSTPKIVGRYMIDNPKEKEKLYKWVKSKNVWERRIAVLATAPMIYKGDLDDILNLAKILLKDNHDLIHKAVGWMLRDAAKKDKKRVEDFLKNNIKQMPRTMLRYTIERFPEEERKAYLQM